MVEMSFRERMKILYIDDDADLVMIYTRFFEHSEYSFKSACNAREGFQTAKVFLPDLIICDVAMPGMSGIDLCRMVRNDNDLKDTVFLLVSGIEVDPEDIGEGYGAGADDYLVKPFSREVIFAKIRVFLKLKKLKNMLKCSDTMVEELTSERDRILGDLKETRQQLEREKEVLHNSLKQISLMVEERDKNSDETQRLQALLTNEKNALVEVLGEIIESKPQYHRGHSSNVSEIAGVIAGMMDLPESDIADIKAAGLLHEIGKASIPQEIAMKIPDAYSPSENDFLVQHPVKGAELLGKIPGLRNVAKIVRHIHEHIDGTGFPFGLVKNKIPIGSRIIAVVNVFDNMVFRSDNLTAEAALEKMEAGVGTRYDSSVFNCLRRYAKRHSVKKTTDSVEMRLFEVKPGMKLAAGIYTVKGAKLLPEDTVLTEENIKQIARYNKVELLEETVFIKD